MFLLLLRDVSILLDQTCLDVVSYRQRCLRKSARGALAVLLRTQRAMTPRNFLGPFVGPHVSTSCVIVVAKRRQKESTFLFIDTKPVTRAGEIVLEESRGISYYISSQSNG